MAETAFEAREALVVGASHRTSSMAARDRLFIEDADLPGVHERLRERGVFQALVLSTCDRIEVQAVHQSGDDTATRIIEVLAEHARMMPAELAAQFTVLSGADAVRQIFRVAASLDSLIVGEPQVLGQVKAAHRLARTCGMIGSELESLLQAAYQAAKRVRTETLIGERPVSIAASAVELARDLHGDLAGCSALVIGAGEMGTLIAEALQGAGLAHVALTHPSPARIEGIARQLNCHVASFEALAAALAEADIVLAAMGRRHYVLGADLVRSALAKRRRKPIFLVDTGIPGDIEPAVSRLDDAFVYDINDLERIAMAGRAEREAEAEKADALIEDAVAAFVRDRAERTAVPVLSLLRDRFEEVRRQSVADAGNDADKATRLLVNRLLHVPSEVIRNAAAEKSNGALWRSLESAVRKLFALDAPSDEKPAAGKKNRQKDQK
ncbi:MAG: glutamyl-tRNA reductase [Rhodospirillales bacterium]